MKIPKHKPTKNGKIKPYKMNRRFNMLDEERSALILLNLVLVMLLYILFLHFTQSFGIHLVLFFSFEGIFLLGSVIKAAKLQDVYPELTQYRELGNWHRQI